MPPSAGSTRPRRVLSDRSGCTVTRRCVSSTGPHISLASIGWAGRAIGHDERRAGDEQVVRRGDGRPGQVGADRPRRDRAHHRCRRPDAGSARRTSTTGVRSGRGRLPAGHDRPSRAGPAHLQHIPREQSRRRRRVVRTRRGPVPDPRHRPDGTWLDDAGHTRGARPGGDDMDGDVDPGRCDGRDGDAGAVGALAAAPAPRPMRCSST